MRVGRTSAKDSEVAARGLRSATSPLLSSIRCRVSILQSMAAHGAPSPTARIVARRMPRRPPHRSARGTGRPGLASARWRCWRALPWSLQRGLGRCIGARRCTHGCASGAAIARRNLELCFPELDAAAARRAAARAASPRSGHRPVRVRARVVGLGRRRCGAACAVEGLEHLDAARAGGRGVIVVSGHFTTLEMCGRLMCDYAAAGRHVPAARAAGDGMGGEARPPALRRGDVPKRGSAPAVRHLKRAACCGTRPTRTRAAATACSCRSSASRRTA